LEVAEGLDGSVGYCDKEETGEVRVGNFPGPSGVEITRAEVTAVRVERKTRV
jgi:hypothetical protein